METGGDPDSTRDTGRDTARDPDATVGTSRAVDPDGTAVVRRPEPGTAGPGGTRWMPAPGAGPLPPHGPGGPGPVPSPGHGGSSGHGTPPPWTPGGPPFGASGHGGGHPPPGPYGPPPGPASGPPRRGRRGRTTAIVAGCVVAALLAGGAVAVVTGVPGRLLSSEEPSVAAAPAVPAAPSPVVGDPRTADPCSLLTASSVRRFGSPDTVPDRGWPNGCSIDLSSNGPGYLSLTASLVPADPGYPPQGTATRAAGGLTVHRETAAPDVCRRTVTAPDGTWVMLSAIARDGGKGDLCAVADAGTATTVTALTSGPLPRRSGAATPSALTELDMCAVADAGVVGRATGVDTTRRQAGFGNWACYWGYDPAFDYSPTVDVSFSRYSRLSGTPVRIGGRAAQVTPATTPGRSCTVDLVHRTYTTPDGSPRVEVVTVRAYTGRQTTTDASCRNARAVADALGPRLPTG